ncbi:MAG TPA: DUF72 domain-containing protein [Kofleriaceae bacterium]|nr:DUF72 domain-containing protein [Kofleriaceae bacterium]
MAARIKIGTTAWADRVLVDTGWYPPHVRSPAAKLAYYASQFPIVENDSTYWAFPDRARVATWAERTPPGFTMSMKAHALLTRHYANVRGLPRDLRESLSPELLAKPHVYPKDVGDPMMHELTRRFHDALAPLHEAGKLGVVLFQFPVWFPISTDNKAELWQIREQFRPYRVAVELRNATWMADDNVDETLGFLAEADLIYTCVDEPQGFISSVPPIAAATSDVAVVRMHGRNPARWDRRARAGMGQYRYAPDELREWLPKLRALAEQTREVHVLFSNGWLDNAVHDARAMTELVERELAGRQIAVAAGVP